MVTLATPKSEPWFTRPRYFSPNFTAPYQLLPHPPVARRRHATELFAPGPCTGEAAGEGAEESERIRRNPYGLSKSLEIRNFFPTRQEGGVRFYVRFYIVFFFFLFNPEWTNPYGHGSKFCRPGDLWVWVNISPGVGPR